MREETEHTCQFCYYEYFDGRAYPCSMCVCGEERKDMFMPKGRENKRKDEPQKNYPTDWCEKCELWRENNCMGVAQCKRNIQILTEAYKAEQTEPQTETEMAKAIVHKMIDDAVIAEDAYPELRQKMHDAVDEYEPQTEPQTCEECEHWSDSEDGCADRHGCKTEQTERSE